MEKYIIKKYDTGRRLDKFLRKFLPDAPLSAIYRMIRKDVKVNSKRVPEDYILCTGDEISLYISKDSFIEFCRGTDSMDFNTSGKFSNLSLPDIVYEDESILICNKPAGLLTHGDAVEKRNTLANQVLDYLIVKGDYNPREELTYRPSPANRLDRNTSGLIMFGKNLSAGRALSQIILNKFVDKYYNTIVIGELKSNLRLDSYLQKNEATNTVRILHHEAVGAKPISTIVKPIEILRRGGETFTLVEIQLLTGRSHQIRAVLADIGHPLIGDRKYKTRQSSSIGQGLLGDIMPSAQLLHAIRLEFHDNLNGLEQLNNRVFVADLPQGFKQILEELGYESNY